MKHCRNYTALKKYETLEDKKIKPKEGEDANGQRRSAQQTGQDFQGNIWKNPSKVQQKK
jgi:hypothetical protein